MSSCCELTLPVHSVYDNLHIQLSSFSTNLEPRGLMTRCRRKDIAVLSKIIEVIIVEIRIFLEKETLRKRC